MEARIAPPGDGYPIHIDTGYAQGAASPSANWTPFHTPGGIFVDRDTDDEEATHACRQAPHLACARPVTAS